MPQLTEYRPIGLRRPRSGYALTNLGSQPCASCRKLRAARKTLHIRATEALSMTFVEPVVDTVLASVKPLLDLLQHVMTANTQSAIRRFDELMRPLNDRVQVVHVDYTDILRNLRRGLFRARDSQGAIRPGNVVTAIDSFRTDRDKQEGIRDHLRVHAAAILGVLPCQQEQRFVYTIIVYFQENDHRPFLEKADIDMRIATILQQGGSSGMATPTTLLLQELNELLNKLNKSPGQESQVLEEMIGCVDATIAVLNDRLSAVSRQYVGLLE